MKLDAASVLVPIQELPQFRHRLLAWYRSNRRDLPWRETRDPYCIWISEVMLQQTRVAVVIDRYHRFLQRFPSVQKLARARIESVLAEWSGLGYYRRARNLHAAARAISRLRDFPRTAQELQELPGIGRYTASAIVSIAFGKAVAVVDGNIERVLSRLSAKSLPPNRLWQVAEGLLDPAHPGDFNQAMMELGATVCLPAQPDCQNCPIHAFCGTRSAGERNSARAARAKREVTRCLSYRGDSVLLIRRPANDRLMPSMWELPEVLPRPSDQRLFTVRHSITITDYAVHVVSRRSVPRGGSWLKVSRVPRLPLTGLTKKILVRAEVI